MPGNCGHIQMAFNFLDIVELFGWPGALLKMSMCTPEIIAFRLDSD